MALYFSSKFEETYFFCSLHGNAFDLNIFGHLRILYSWVTLFLCNKHSLFDDLCCFIFTQGFFKKQHQDLFISKDLRSTEPSEKSNVKGIISVDFYQFYVP